jgi:hypothetical protein
VDSIFNILQTIINVYSELYNIDNIRMKIIKYSSQEPILYIAGLYGKLNAYLFLLYHLSSFINKLCFMYRNYYSNTPGILRCIHKFWMTHTFFIIPHIFFIQIISDSLLYIFNYNYIVQHEWSYIYICLWLAFCNIIMLLPFIINVIVLKRLENKYMKGFCGEWDDRPISTQPNEYDLPFTNNEEILVGEKKEEKKIDIIDILVNLETNRKPYILDDGLDNLDDLDDLDDFDHPDRLDDTDNKK